MVDPNSSVNYALNKTETQEKIGESRFETAQVMVDQFNDDETEDGLRELVCLILSLLKNKRCTKWIPQFLLRNFVRRREFPLFPGISQFYGFQTAY